MASWRDALARTRRGLTGAWSRWISRPAAGRRETLDELEAALLGADVPVKLVAALLAETEPSPGRDADAVRDALARRLQEALAPARAFTWDVSRKPLSVMVVGVNGSGKTTTCAKLAHLARRRGLMPLLGAADTYRAAGAEQLRLWAGRVACDVVAGATGGDAAAVAFDALDAAHRRGADLLILDTAGRMHTRQPLMQELEKIRRAMGKRLDRAPDETWLVLDAALGQNAIAQARQFHQAVPLTGLVVTKLDGSSKAGFLFSCVPELQVPVLFAGLGESPDDLAPFDPAAFVDALLPADRATENAPA
jgi:fused signal recognition particle receptor